MKETDLQAAPSTEIFEMVEEYVTPMVSAADLIEACRTIDLIRKMKPEVRGAISQYLASGQLFCRECGATSCIHGYSDE